MLRSVTSVVCLLFAVAVARAEGAGKLIVADVPSGGWGDLSHPRLLLTLREDGTPIDAREFYRAVGRGDLAERYERRRRAKIALQIAGLALVGAATAGLVWHSASDGVPDAVGWTAAGVGLAGGTMQAIGALLSPHPIDAAEADALAAAHNRRIAVGVAPLPGGGGCVAVGGGF